MARNARTFSDLDLNFIPSPMSLVINTGIGLLTASTTSNIVYGTRLWTPLTSVTVGQTFFWASDVADTATYRLYTCTFAGITGSSGPSHTTGTASNGSAKFLFNRAQPTDAAVTNFEKYDMLYRNLYCGGIIVCNSILYFWWYCIKYRFNVFWTIKFIIKRKRSFYLFWR